MTKRCASCNLTKPAEAFYASKTNTSGLNSWCRDCCKHKAMMRYNAEEAARKREQRRALRLKMRDLERQRLRDSLTHKTCQGCKETKTVDCFSKSNSARDGLQSKCKKCQAEYGKRTRHKKPRFLPDPHLLHKRCTRCGEKQPVSQFALNSRAPDGYQYACRGCQRVYDQARYWSKAKKASEPSPASDISVISMRKKLHDLERRTLLASFGVFDISIRDLKRLANSPCAHCGATSNLSIDHIIPVKRGGRHSIGNLQSLCKSCNSSKSCLLEVEWRYGRSSAAMKKAM